MFFTKPVEPLPKITAPTAAEIAAKSKPSPQGQALLKPGMTPPEYLHAALDGVAMDLDVAHYDTFADLYLAQPRAMSDVEAMVASFVALVPTVERIRRRVGLYSRALASSAVLRGREAELKDEQVHKIAETIARRAGGPGATARSELLASIGDLVMGRSLDRWLREPDDRANLTELIVDEFAAVLELFGSRPSSRRRRTR